MAHRWLAGIVLVLSMGLAGCAGSSKYMVKADPPTAGPPQLIFLTKPLPETTRPARAG